MCLETALRKNIYVLLILVVEKIHSYERQSWQKGQLLTKFIHTKDNLDKKVPTGFFRSKNPGESIGKKVKMGEMLCYLYFSAFITDFCCLLCRFSEI